jgi:hypothetical protein
MNIPKTIAERAPGCLVATVAVVFALCGGKSASAADLGGGVLGEVESMRQEDFMERFQRWAVPAEEEEVVEDVGAWPEAWKELEKQWDEEEAGHAGGIGMDPAKTEPGDAGKNKEFWRETEKPEIQAISGESAAVQEFAIELPGMPELEAAEEFEALEAAVAIEETSVEAEEAVAELSSSVPDEQLPLAGNPDAEEEPELSVAQTEPEVSEEEESGDFREAMPLSRAVSNPFRVETTTNEWFFRGTGTWCDEPQLKQAWWVTGAPPAVASAVVKEVRLDGVAAHAVRVDGQDVVWEPGVHLFLQLGITDEILDLQGRRFLLTLYCWPDEDDPTNEVYLGDEEYGPFRVEWDWWVFDETAAAAPAPETAGLAETARRVLAFDLVWPEEGDIPAADLPEVWRRYSGSGLPAGW